MQDKESFGGMSDWSMYQLDDNVWDEFRESDDHIVPHPGGEHVEGCSNEGDCYKKSRKSPDSKSIDKDESQENGDNSFISVRDTRGSMLEKGSWSQTTGGEFPDSCGSDCKKEMTGVDSFGTKTSSNCFKSNNIDSFGNDFCKEDSILGNTGSSFDGNMCNFSLDDISPTNSDLDLFRNGHEENENSFHLYYGWPDIGNFEDVDRMFRNCDSTFGQGNTSNDDELSWFSSSSRVIDGCEDALKSGFKSSYSDFNISKSTLKHHEAAAKPVADSNTSGNIGTLDNSYGTWLDTNVENNRVYASKEQEHEVDDGVQVTSSSITHNSYASSKMANLQSKQLKNHNQREGKRKNRSSEIFSSDSLQNSGTTQQCSHPTERSLNFSPNYVSMDLDENIKKIHLQKQTPSTLNIDRANKGMLRGAVFSDPHPAQRLQIEGESTDLRAVEVDSSNAQESSGMNSISSDGMSLEATSFRHLQYVMEQLDTKTKLCIRDSLYRLARSAEQRNNFGNFNSCTRDATDKNGDMVAEESNKCAGFVDMETDTNPIDRSIAHLLFHRPSDHAECATSLESRTIVQGPISSQPVMPGKAVYQEVALGNVDSKLLNTEQ